MSLSNLMEVGGIRLDSREMRILIAEWGEKEVEETLIYIQRSYDHRGLRVRLQPTYDMIRAVIEAKHGRLSVGCVKLSGDKGFYHHPDGVE